METGTLRLCPNPPRQWETATFLRTQLHGGGAQGYSTINIQHPCRRRIRLWRTTFKWRSVLIFIPIVVLILVFLDEDRAKDRDKDVFNLPQAVAAAVRRW